MKQLLRDPLAHFILIGAALFAVYTYTQPEANAGPEATEIRLSLDEITQLVMLFQSQWRREPTSEELDRLVENRVEQEILYREALAMGLDKNDEIVRRRMAQKMQFLAEDVAAAREPTTDELQTWFANNKALFGQSPRVSFRHLYFSPDTRGTRARDDAALTLERLAGQPEDTKRADTLADPFMFQEYYRDRTPDFLGKEFGPQFAEAVAQLAPGSWQGPVQSGYGWHLVFVDTAIPGRMPDFEEIENEVKTAWLAEQKALAWDKTYKEMRARYTVLLPVTPEQDAAAAPASTTDGSAP